MEQGLKGNMGLQYTVATLEKLFLEPDYPSHKRVPKLPESPRDLGISRADLWAFAAKVAVEYATEQNNFQCSGSPASASWFGEGGSSVSGHQDCMRNLGEEDCQVRGDDTSFSLPPMMSCIVNCHTPSIL